MNAPAPPAAQIGLANVPFETLRERTEFLNDVATGLGTQQSVDNGHGLCHSLCSQAPACPQNLLARLSAVGIGRPQDEIRPRSALLMNLGPRHRPTSSRRPTAPVRPFAAGHCQSQRHGIRSPSVLRVISKPIASAADSCPGWDCWALVVAYGVS